MRNFVWKNDFELVQKFLIETYNLTQKFFNWAPTRFENRKMGPCGTIYQDEEDALVKIWEIDTDDSQKKITAVTIMNSSDANWIQIHPEYREYERELTHYVEWQVMNNPSGEKTSNFYVLESDEYRKSLLKKLDYKYICVDVFCRFRPLDLPAPDYQLPEGYTLRGINIASDYEKYREVQGSVFKHCGKMTKEQFEIYTSASFYNPKLDIVAVAPNGQLAAFATFRFDPRSKIVELEPVGTHPEHRKLGLGTAIISEGLTRLNDYNPTAIVILGAANTPGANRLYDKLGFTDKEAVELWQKKIKAPMG